MKAYTVNAEGVVESNLAEMLDGFHDDVAHAMESMILAHHAAGIDISSESYHGGVLTALDALSNHYEEEEE